MVNLQTQLAYLKEQAAQTSLNNSSSNENPNVKSTPHTLPQDLQSLFQVENSNNYYQHGQEFITNNMSNISLTTQHYGNNNHMDLNPMRNYEENSSSFSSFEESTSNSISYDMQTNRRTWGFDEVEDLHSVAFGYS